MKKAEKREGGNYTPNMALGGRGGGGYFDKGGRREESKGRLGGGMTLSFRASVSVSPRGHGGAKREKTTLSKGTQWGKSGKSLFKRGTRKLESKRRKKDIPKGQVKRGVHRLTQSDLVGGGDHATLPAKGDRSS